MSLGEGGKRTRGLLPDGAAANSPDGGSQEAASSEVFALCDGTQRLRLWAFVEPGGNELRGSMVRTENGSPFLAVDGLCSYWTGGGWTEDALGQDREIRRGGLTDSEVATLEQGVALGDVSSLRDCGAPAGLFDASVLVIATQKARAECGYQGQRFDAAWAVVESVAKSLWARGSALDGALHVSAVESPNDFGSSPQFYGWPLDMPLNDFLLAPGYGGSNLALPGVSKLVADPDLTRPLRDLRGRYLSDRDAQPGLYSNWDGLGTTDGVTSAILYMRDAMPYEDGSGLLQF